MNQRESALHADQIDISYINSNRKSPQANTLSHHITMMISPQAARMGTVFTTLRKLGASSSSLRRGSSLIDRVAVRRVTLPPRNASWSLAPLASSSFSTSPQYDDDVEEDAIVDRSFGHAAAMEARQHSMKHSQDESWMINLGREDDAWLHGPREAKHWFTGVAPKDCPGVDQDGIVLRSLPLPNLSAVTRQAAKDYFDNSWTLYETLFAGLKGEEGFYRYVAFTSIVSLLPFVVIANTL